MWGSKKWQSQTFRALAHRNYRLYWASQLVSLFGSWMQIVALNWLAYRLTHSPLALGLLNFVAVLPAGLFMLAGGAISDRLPGRRLLLVLESTLALQALILAVLTWMDVVTIWHVAIVMFVVGAANSLEVPARAVLVMDVVGESDYPNAVGLNSAMINLARAAGPAVAGWVIGTSGEAVCFALNAFSYLAVIAALGLMRLSPSACPREPLRIGSDTLTGIRYAWRNPAIRTLLVVIAIPSLLAQPAILLLPVFAQDVLHVDATGYGWLMGMVGGGAVIGALIAGGLNANKRQWGLVTGSLLFPAFLVLFALSRWLPMSLALLFGAALGQSLQLVVAYSMLLLTAQAEFRGRVASSYALLSNGLNRMGGVPLGFAAQVWGAPIAVLSGASLSLIWALVVIWRMPVVRKLK